MPKLSVVMCTYNPRPDLLVRSLRAVAVQSMKPADYELIVVDNNSPTPLDKARLERLAGRSIKLVVEKRQGLTYARVAGFENATADHICFIDDDNEVHPTYFETAARIGRREPDLGVFGGVAHGVLEKPVGRIIRAYLPHLGVRDMGRANLTGEGEKWGPHEPIGAGIVVKKEIGAIYSAFVNSEAAAGGLGRSGKHLLSGEDSLLSRMAWLDGYKVGYRPDLQLRHHITEGRLNWKYMKRLMEGHGRSYVILQRIMGHDVEPLPKGKQTFKVFANFMHRRKHNGFRDALGNIYWDTGFFEQSRIPPTSQLTLVDFYHRAFGEARHAQLADDDSAVDVDAVEDALDVDPLSETPTQVSPVAATS